MKKENHFKSLKEISFQISINKSKLKTEKAKKSVFANRSPHRS